MSVIVPEVVPVATTLTPIKACPFRSVTVPDKEIALD